MECYLGVVVGDFIAVTSELLIQVIAIASVTNPFYQCLPSHLTYLQSKLTLIPSPPVAKPSYMKQLLIVIVVVILILELLVAVELLFILQLLKEQLYYQ